MYILASPTRELYVGVTNDLARRLGEHRDGKSAFTRAHGTTRLVYAEQAAEARVAIAREKQVKGWKRVKKIELIEGMNPEWEDFGLEWGLIEESR